MGYDQACAHVYGMPYKDWKKLHQQTATEEQLSLLEQSKEGHAQHEPPSSTASQATRTPHTHLVSDVCCQPVPGHIEAAPPVQVEPVVRPPPREHASTPEAIGTAAAYRTQGAPVVIRLGVLTVSDRASAGVYEDLGGPEVVRAVEEFVASGAAGGVTLELVRRATVPDESDAIQRLLLEWTERGAEPCCNLLLTTGGTGLSPRDVTPEATLAVVDRPVRK